MDPDRDFKVIRIRVQECIVGRFGAKVTVFAEFGWSTPGEPDGTVEANDLATVHSNVIFTSKSSRATTVS